MGRLLWLIVWIVSTNTVLGSPVHRRTGRLGHVIHYHKEGPAGSKHRKHVHLPENQTSNTHHGHNVSNTQHAMHDHLHAHAHGGHSHDMPRASAQRAPHHNHAGHPQKVQYDVPSHRHFASNKKDRTHAAHGAHAAHGETNEGRKSLAISALGFDLSSLMIDKDLFKNFSSTELKDATTKTFSQKTEATTPMPDRWKMKNTVQVSDTRSFESMFRQALGGRKLPIKTVTSRDRVVDTNTRQVVRYVNKLEPTIPSKSISKRGIGRLGSNLPRKSAQRGNEIFENKLTIRVWNESKLDNVINTQPKNKTDRRALLARTTRRFTPVTAAPKFTQGRLGRIITKQTRLAAAFATTSAPYKPPASTRIEYTLKTQGTTSKPNLKATDMVKLEGIHVMFADGVQRRNKSVPTLHLTAALADTANKTQKGHNQQQNGVSKNNTLLKDLQTIINKIVGTAIIKNGHLYLVVYPFGNSKSVNLRFPSAITSKADTTVATSPTPNRTQLPTNKPVPIPGMERQPPRPSTWKSTPSTPTPGPATIKPISIPAFPTSVPLSPMDHLLHGHVHHSMNHSMGHVAPMATDKNNINHDPLAPIPRFMSPWKAVNLSSIFPQPTNVTLLDDDDKDVKVVPFVAQATDPFDKIKMILAALANKTENATSSQSDPNNPLIDPTADASFNFELKIKGDILATTKDKKQEMTTPNDNTSEERTTDYAQSQHMAKMTVTTPSVTKSARVTESAKKYVTRVRTILTTKFVTQVEPTATTLHHLSPAPTDSVSNPKGVSKSVTAANTEKSSSTNLLTSSQITFGRVADKERGSRYIGPYPGPLFDSHTATSTQKEGAFMSQTVRQLHESENLVNTKPSIARSPLPRPTTEAPIVATPSPRSQISQEKHLVRVTMSPTNQPQQVLPMVQTSSSFDSLMRDSQVAARMEANKQENNRRIQQTVVSPLISQPENVKTAKQPAEPAADTTFSSHNLNRGQSEQIISLADVLTDIRKIQLHNMQRFNIQNNNFNTMLLSNTDRASSLRSQVFNKYPRIPISQGSGFQSRPTTRPVPTMAWQPRQRNRQTAMRDAIDAMLVLSVDDIVADHTNLHGALVLSQPRDSSSGSSSSNK